MAIVRTFNGVELVQAGAFSKIVVENLTGFPLEPTGTVGIIGEAIGGRPGVLDILQGAQIQDAKARYKSGPIAEAMELLTNPSVDGRVPNGASKVVVYKTNNSTQGGLDLLNEQDTPANIVELVSKNYGDDENQTNVTVFEGSVADANAQLVGTIDGPFTLAGGETLILRVNGANYTFTNTLTGSTAIGAMVTELDTPARWAPSKPVIATANLLNVGRVQLDLDTSVVANSKLDYGYMEVDATSTIDTILGITGENRGVKGSRIIQIKKGTKQETSLDLGGIDVMSIQYIGAGTECSLDIQSIAGEIRLQTTATGAAADNLDILLEGTDGSPKITLQELADLIDANAAYDASALYFNPDINANEMDFYSALLIKDVPAVLKRDVFDFNNYVSTFSELLDASKVNNAIGAIAVFSSPLFLTGASDGVSTNTDFADGFNVFLDERINVVVPLISKDKGALTIDSINALCNNHVIQASSTLGKSERNAYVSKNTSKTLLKDAARSLNAKLVSMVGQQVRVLDNLGNLVWLDPWAAACIAAGMQAGTEVGEPLTYKLLNVNNIRVEDGSWLPIRDADEIVKAGIFAIENIDTGGFRWKVGNTTFQSDGFYENRVSVQEAGNFVAYDLRSNLEARFTGTKAKTGSAEAVANFIKERMSIYLDADIIVGDDLNEGLGYNQKKLRVLIEGNTAKINLSITPVQGIDFILPTIYIQDIRQSA